MSRAVSPLAFLAATLLVASSGCVLHTVDQSAAPGTTSGFGTGTNPGPVTGMPGNESATPAATSSGTSNQGTASQPPSGTSGTPSWSACAEAPEDMAAQARVRVTDASGQEQSGVAVKAMQDWTEYDMGTTDSTGCVAFHFVQAGEYEFATDGGDCTRQGTATLEWAGGSDARVSLVLDDVCNQA